MFTIERRGIEPIPSFILFRGAFYLCLFYVSSRIYRAFFFPSLFRRKKGKRFAFCNHVSNIYVLFF